MMMTTTATAVIMMALMRAKRRRRAEEVKEVKAPLLQRVAALGLAKTSSSVECCAATTNGTVGQEVGERVAERERNADPW